MIVIFNFKSGVLDLKQIQKTQLNMNTRKIIQTPAETQIYGKICISTRN